MSDCEDNTKEIEALGKFRIDRQTFVAGQRVRLRTDLADMCIQNGWAKCMQTGFVGKRNTDPVTIQIPDDSEERGRHAEAGGRPLKQFEREYLKGLKEKFESANKKFDDPDQVGHIKAYCLMLAVNYCAELGLAMPVWVANALMRRIVPWLQYKVGSLDEAFGTIPRTTKRVTTARKNFIMRQQIIDEVAKLRANGKPVPWNDLSAKLGTSKTHLQNLYYQKMR